MLVLIICVIAGTNCFLASLITQVLMLSSPDALEFFSDPMILSTVSGCTGRRSNSGAVLLAMSARSLASGSSDAGGPNVSNLLHIVIVHDVG